MNVGETDEILIKIKLLYLREKGIYSSIQNVNGKEIPCLNDVLDDNFHFLTKADSFSKADIVVDGKGVSLKSFRGSNPTIINHTPRYGILKICDRINFDISDLDNLINLYWESYDNGHTFLDIRNRNDSLFYSYKEYLKPLLNYFLFDGTAHKVSNCKADQLLSCGLEPFDETDWKWYDRSNAVEHIWDNIVFSMRSKGMPKQDKPENKKWVNEISDKKIGAFHVRLKF